MKNTSPLASRAFIGLGANLGDAQATLAHALNDLATAPGVSLCGVSGFYRSAPIDANGPDYVNAVAQVDTELSPHALLDCLQAIERAHGRQRPYRNAPRTLDLDLLLFDNCVLHDAELTLPHPRLHERAFVLKPLQDLAPELQLAQGTLAALLARCSDQRLERLANADPSP